MAFFQELGKKIGEVAQDAQKKTSELIEINRLNGSIKDEKEAIDSIYKKIGTDLYARFAAGESVPDHALADLQAVADRLRTILGLEAKITQLKSDSEKPATTPAAPTADNVVNEASVEAVPEPEQPETAPEEAQPVATSARFCTGCGTPLEPGAVFCSHCGSKVD